MIYLFFCASFWKSDDSAGADGWVHVWAVTVEGEAVYRKGVSRTCPAVSLVLILTAYVYQPQFMRK